MTKDRIRQLAKLIPEGAIYFNRGIDSAQDTNQRHLITRDNLVTYDPSFGWQLIKSLLQGNLPLPSWADETYLRRAYKFELGKNSRDYAVIEAIGMNHPRNFYRRSIFQAALLTESTFETVSNRLGYPEETLRAYEQLFFNVRDRKHDHMYIGSITFENGILIEHLPNYLQRENSGTILIRAAVRHGLETALDLAGLTPGRMLSGEAFDSAAKIEARIMGGALSLLDYGLGNQPVRALSHARGLIQAAKASGQQTKTTETVGVSSLGDSIMNELLGMADQSIRKIAEAKPVKGGGISMDKLIIDTAPAKAS